MIEKIIVLDKKKMAYAEKFIPDAHFFVSLVRISLKKVHGLDECSGYSA